MIASGLLNLNVFILRIQQGKNILFINLLPFKYCSDNRGRCTLFPDDFTKIGVSKMQEDKAKAALSNHLKLMRSQRVSLVAVLDEMQPALLWKKPSEDAWSIGENLDHLRVIYNSWMGFVRMSWFFFSPLAHLRRAGDFQTDIDNVYRRPGFPQKVGWIWPPRYTPVHPAPYALLKRNLEKVHQQAEEFYLSRDALLLGHVSLYDPAIGNINLIQALRVAVYHDEMHIEQILHTLAEVGS